MADRSDDLARRRRRLNEPNGLGIVAQRIGIPNAARNDHDIIVFGGGVLQMPIEPDPAAGSDKGNRHDVGFTHVGNLEAMETRVAGLLGRDQVNLRTARPEIVQDSGQLDLLDAVGCDDGDLPAGMAFGVVGRHQPDIPDRAVFRRVEHLRIGQLGHRSRCLGVEKCPQW